MTARFAERTKDSCTRRSTHCQTKRFIYRISDVSEMDEIGYEEYFYSDGVCLVEWGKLIDELFPDNTTYISISKDLSKGFDYRKVEVATKEMED